MIMRHHVETMHTKNTRGNDIRNRKKESRTILIVLAFSPCPRSRPSPQRLITSPQISGRLRKGSK